MNDKPALRFDHREIAVIFSLFVFVSLLMFTVGILVGKGLAQARYEGILLRDAERARSAETFDGNPSVAMPPRFDPGLTPIQRGSSAPETSERTPMQDGDVKTLNNNAPKKSEPLQLVPQKAKAPDVFGNSLQEPAATDTAETDHILKNPKLKALFDDTDEKKRATASLPSKFPTTFATGKFTVQVGSYPTEKDAAERVEGLKKLGFAHAYFTAKELGDKKDMWYRVWLGYYPDLQSAQQSGQMLQKRGEVKNYLVRKTDGEN